MKVLREYDTVRVVKLTTENRDYDGTEGVQRPPRVGDTRAILHEYEPEKPNGLVAVEDVYEDGNTIWLADFSRDELELVSRPGPRGS